MLKQCLVLLGFFSAMMVAVSAQEGSAPPKGEVLKFSFDKSNIFPGTIRDVWVYVPKQYDGKTPACVYINQDGIQYKAPEVFDQLIHQKQMPVTIGVFVMHGRVRALNPDAALDRFNRSYEYDGLGDHYARFLLEELLPEVETKKTSDGREIKLSQCGNDRAIGGASSGAICAFTAAWERPDAFSRVFSAIGTYVGLRGGHNYSTLIRKVEPKPIRIFLEDGSNDLNIYGGDWWMANQSMQRSLAFAGYDIEYRWGDGGHNTNHATKIFPDAMKFLWKGWPEPVRAGQGSPQLKELLIPGEDWKLVGEGYTFSEGPTTSKEGVVYFCDVPKSKIYKVDAFGKAVEWCSDSLRTSGLAFGPDGNLYGASAQGITKFSPDGQVEVVAKGFAANDLVVTHQGTIYATNPNADPKERSRVMMIRDGNAKIVDTGLTFANGVTVSPDQSLLYVADSRTHWVYSYLIQPDGTLAYKQKYFHLHQPDTANDAGADGLRTDLQGRLWVSTRMGLQVCDQAGRVNAMIPTPNGKCSNLTFGGPHYDTIYVTAQDKVYSRKVRVMGANSFAPPIKPKPPGL